MSITFHEAVESYVKQRSLSRGTLDEYAITLRKWNRWGNGVPLQQLDRQTIRSFLEWVHDDAVDKAGSNPGRTANKARENLRAVMSWAWERDIIDALPRFPRPSEQRDVTGRHYLTKSELNALYFATYKMRRPRGWDKPYRIGRYWRAALVLFFNYGMDTGTVWKTLPRHEPLLWRQVCWEAVAPDGQTKERSRYGWLFYRRVKTQKSIRRPMNRYVRAHLESIRPKDVDMDAAVLEGGGSRPNLRFQELCQLAGIRQKVDIETGDEKPWLLKDLRKTCATYYDEHMPESSIEILGHSVKGITYRHYAHRDPLAFKAIMTIPQPSSFRGLANGFDGQCPCCRRDFASET